MPRPRTQAQKDAEKRAEAESHGKTLVRHTEESAADLATLRERFPGESDPTLIRLAMREMAGAGNAPVVHSAAKTAPKRRKLST